MESGIEVVTTPTGDWLRNAARGCHRFTVSSPFVTCEMSDLLSQVDPGAKCRLLTRTRLADFALGVSDLDTLRELHALGVRIKRHSLLHAKVYVIDSTVALVTSANATRYGMNVNLECGLAVSDAKIARRIERDIWSGFGASEAPANVTATLINELYEILPTVRVRVPALPRGDLKVREEQELLEIPDLGRFLDRLSGWTRLTFKSVLALGKARFTLRELYSTAVPEGQKRYPGNKHVQAKIRQQMQRLRDLGIVQFEEPGTYRVLFQSGQ